MNNQERIKTIDGFLKYLVDKGELKRSDYKRVSPKIVEYSIYSKNDYEG